MNNSDGPMQLSATRHLLQRTGFAESPLAVVAASDIPVEELLEQRLQSTEPISPLPPPAWVDDPIVAESDNQSMRDKARQQQRKTLRKRQNEQTDELRAWWLSSLIQTRNPLGARMTLFWQNHFTSQQRKVRYPQLMYQQQNTLMQHAMGNFGDLLAAMLRDPAMLIYLDNRANRRKKPNENLARELLELFALGEGNYQEADIRELARALTGLTIDREKNYQFRPGHHDSGEKTLLGTRGKLGADEVVEILLKQSATATHLVSKLWQAFISPVPEQSQVVQWAEHLRDSDYDLHSLLSAMFRSDAFNDPSVHGQLIKSPVEFIVGTHRLLEVPPVDGNSLLRASRSMQQNLYEPPNVRGWIGGPYWINSHTLLARRRFITLMLRNDAIDMRRLHGDLENETIISTLLPLPLDPPDDGKTDRPIERALRSPIYHLS